MAGLIGRTDQRLRPAQQGFDRHRGIGRDRHERGIGSVFEQAAHQIGQQIPIAADRRISPAGQLRVQVQQAAIQRIPHAVQALEFETLEVSGIGQHGRNRQRIMGGKLRIEPRTRRQQTASAGLIGQIRHRLAGKDRKIRQTPFLCAFDLAVPIGSFDQTHHDGAIKPLCQSIAPVDHLHCPFLVGLNRQTEPAPTRKRGIGKHRADHIQRQFEPVGLLGIDGEIEIMGLGRPRQIEHDRAKFGHHLCMGRRLVARMQRR